MWRGLKKTSYGGLPYLDFLVFPVLYRGETGVAGEGRLVYPTDAVEKSMGASWEISLSYRESSSHSGRLEKE